MTAEFADLKTEFALAISVFKFLASSFVSVLFKLSVKFFTFLTMLSTSLKPFSSVKT